MKVTSQSVTIIDLSKFSSLYSVKKPLRRAATFLLFHSRSYGLEFYVRRCGLGLESVTQSKRGS